MYNAPPEPLAGRSLESRFGEIFVIRPVSVRWFSLLSLGTLAAMLGYAGEPPRAWPPEAVVFCSDRGGPWRIWLANADGSQPRELTAEGSKITT